ncbi:hypothetical protein D0862_10394 [Hortaea werneckii]|uniref:Choline kinase N-terminal domain-containing protein n=1 Tax=Hortaea werneckii TaxID=91943 RepID=A0A3M7FIE4_HORWE|nr:hypothetical protein D0862_10394 [Hortaea werneckii]
MPNDENASPKPNSILKQQDPQGCASPSSILGIKHTMSPRSTPKSVSIAPQSEGISPLMLGRQKSQDAFDLEHSTTPKKTRSKGLSSEKTSSRGGGSSPPSRALADGSADGDDKDSIQDQRTLARQLDVLVEQVSSWISDERNKLAESKTADSSGEKPDLDKLENILKTTLSISRPLPLRKTPLSLLRHKSSLKKLHARKASTVSSDTDYFESGEAAVPSCDAVLDNSKTLSYTGGASEESDVSSGDELTRSTSFRDQDAWSKFKFEIVRLAHTLRLKGWRKVPLEMCNAITVQRLSGALTNAVYVVSPPSDLPPRDGQDENGNSKPKPRKPPPKLLLRIYGPQVEHLIDRDAELAILRRLARKHIGPRLLGTFANGRFEEYFHAQPLTPEELRNPDTSRQIAKRMRELHEGIELLPKERDSGPFVWLNWDKWVDRVERVVSWLDEQVMMLEPGAKPSGQEAWKRRGYICGMPWKSFRRTVEKYRTWLEQQYGGVDKVKDRLVFAHNDTQYGNILRMMPTGESPLLLPANTHKQLVVIDFEYSNANCPGQEFANHFSEWTYNYHDERKPYVCNTARYPTPEEQDRFVRAYIRHQPQHSVSTPKVTPLNPPTGSSSSLESMGSRPKPTSNYSDFMLDARAPPGAGPSTQPSQQEEVTEPTAAEDADVARLLHETRLWRLANTTQWVAWGIVQAKVPGMPDFAAPAPPSQDNNTAETAAAGEEAAREELGERGDEYRELVRMETAQSEPPTADDENVEEEFDYLGYAQHRALWFWSDALQLGIVTEGDLPDELLGKVRGKGVPY